MAGRPKGSTNNSKPNTEVKVKVVEAKTEPKIVEKKIEKKRLKLDDTILISIKSNVFGGLIYVNHKTGDDTRWENFGEVQPLSVGDLRAMKAKQLSFFKENWITIDGIEDSDSEYEDVSVEEIYDALQISQYYTSFLCPSDINQIFNWKTSDMKEKIPRMTRSVRESIAIRANELIKSGILDSISKVKALEEILGCELASSED